MTLWLGTPRPVIEGEGGKERIRSMPAHREETNPTRQRYLQVSVASIKGAGASNEFAARKRSDAGMLDEGGTLRRAGSVSASVLLLLFARCVGLFVGLIVSFRLLCCLFGFVVLGLSSFAFVVCWRLLGCLDRVVSVCVWVLCIVRRTSWLGEMPRVTLRKYPGIGGLTTHDLLAQ